MLMIKVARVMQMQRVTFGSCLHSMRSANMLCVWYLLYQMKYIQRGDVVSSVVCKGLMLKNLLSNAIDQMKIEWIL